LKLIQTRAANSNGNDLTYPAGKVKGKTCRLAPIMLPYIKLIRPKHWVKNLFVLIPPFFAGKFFDYHLYPRLALGFAAFSLAASSVYILNDFRDRETDRMHPLKSKRPLASGSAKTSMSLMLMAILLAFALVLAFWLEFSFFLLLVAYLVINVAYSMGLKDIPILDIILVASGFLFRVYSGSLITHIPTSHWLALMIMLLSLFLALAKRRDDLVIGKDKNVLRKSSRQYNLEFVNSCLTLFAGVIVVCYIMYTVTPEVTERLKSQWLFTTTIFVIAGVMRYLQIAFVEQNSGSPTSVLLKDRFMLITLAGWILSFYVVIYLA
jgi:4-hydroxybenzoate polyprenyltransferase